MSTYQEAYEASLQYFQGDTLAAKTFVDKYALRDKEGDYKELTPEAMHRRLAKEFARIENKYSNPMSEEEIFKSFDRFLEIIPQGSPMSSIGNPYQIQSAGNCFVEGTKVLTTRGVVSIEQVSLGDRVVTHTGSVKPVVQLHKNPLEDRQLYDVKLFRTPKITVTENHNFWSITSEQLGWGECPQWNSVDKLRKGDWVALPNKNKERSASFVLDVSGVLLGLDFKAENNDYTFSVSEDTVSMATHYTYTSRKDNIINLETEAPAVKRYWKVDSDFCRFLGLWYGDGCVFNESKKSTRVRGITFTFGEHEKDLISFVAGYGSSLFGVDSTFSAPGDGSVSIRFNSGLIGRVFESIFGRSFNNKKCPEWFYTLDYDKFYSCLVGLVESDGTVTASGDVRVVMGNAEVIDSFYHVARSFGLPLGRSYSKVCSEFTGNEEQIYHRLDFPKYAGILENINKSYEDDRIEKARAKEESKVKLKYIGGVCFVRLDKKIKRTNYVDFVYTLGVEDDHSYSVEGVICQNCFVIEPPVDSYGGILYSDQQLVQLAKRRAGIGFDISNIRPKGMITNNAAKTTDGIGVFMVRFSNSCREVAQHGRRGALLLSISCHHPEIMTFIKIKQDKKMVTGANVSVRFSDEFMEAVENNKEVNLRWPVDSETPSISEWANAKEIYDAFIFSNWASAEPGSQFSDTISRLTPADAYAEVYPQFKTTSSNPCFSGDTLIAVADGRNAVSIKKLAEEGRDVPVYSADPRTGLISIKMGRNPRITGYNKELVRVWLDNGTYFDTTPDHKFMLRGGAKCEAQHLVKGNSLSPFYKRLEPVVKGGKDYYRVYTNSNDPRKNKIFEHRLIAEYFYPEVWESKYSKEKSSGWINGGLVIHHKDYNSLNNCPDNLQVLSFREHSKHHADNDTQGEKNGRFSGHSNKTIREHAIKLASNLGCRFSNKEWRKYAKKNGLPQLFTKYRKDALGSVTSLAKWAATEIGLEYTEEDPRVVRTIQEARAFGYKAEVIEGRAIIYKECEGCGLEFKTSYKYREVCFCSTTCFLGVKNADGEFQSGRLEKVMSTYKKKAEVLRQDQVKIYSKLKFDLGRDPLCKEWEQACKESNLPFRLYTKFGYGSYAELKEVGDSFNHKVIKVEALTGRHTVYNITVEDNHTVSIVNPSKNKEGKTYYTGVNVFQCGEIVMGVDSCRLMIINLHNFVVNPFTAKAFFDHSRYAQAVQRAQRLMDDMIDIELELIDRIIKKIKSDIEPPHIKKIELDMWKQFKNNCELGRRTGLGITGLADCLASLGVKYGSDESVEVTESLYKALAINSYKMSCILAGERGAFPLYDFEVEKNHPFIKQVIAQDKELKALYKAHGRRNIANTTTAPAGSVSIVAQVSSGIEPVFLAAYKRRKKLDPGDTATRVDYIDEMGDRWQEFEVFHHGLKRWMDISGNTDIEKSPYWKATSADVDWENSVKLQAAAQRWVCHSISKTCNLPKEASLELISKCYMLAWKSGCKGFTIYREGSRAGVLISNGQKEVIERPQVIVRNQAPKRSSVLPVDIYHSKVGGELWTIVVGLLNGEPYELFGGPSDEASVPKSVKSGFMRKRKESKHKNQYDLTYLYNNKEVVVKDVGNIFESETHSTFTRVLSLSLRHGAPVQHIVEQLAKNESEKLNSLSSVLRRALKRYIKDGTELSSSSARCPKCEGAELWYQEGCLSCRSCGFSKCG